ncbi:MAG: adenine phosphoribosyltransferase [Verrucomicrobia bacterium]|nr:adenine phosphoribosyltransferase [Verrucomicrobiota bacterium]
MQSERSRRLLAAIRDVPDFPQPGVLFKDITPVLSDHALFAQAIDALIEPLGSTKVDKVVGIDARGFIFASAVALRVGAGLVPVRKRGKLPWHTRRLAYTLEYGEAEVEIHEDGISPGESVWLVDDLLATGGTAGAAQALIKEVGGELVATSFLIELAALGGRSRLCQKSRVHSVLVY